MKILSLFDGISCARVALERVGIPVEAYYASEVDKYAMQISTKNYPDIIQVGSVVGLDTAQFKDIDLLIGGSPCQDLSMIKSKTRKGLKGEKSQLFYEFIRVLREVKPKYFILENVASMSEESKNTMTLEIGVEPIEIDSGLVSAQTRKRLFWTNIPNVQQPKSRGLVLRDVMLPVEMVEEKYWYDHPLTLHGEDKSVCATMEFKNQEMHKRVFNPLFKSPTLTTCAGGGLQKKVLQNGRARKLTPLEYERLQSLPDGYTDCVADTNRYNAIGNAFNVDVVAHIISFIPTV